MLLFLSLLHAGAAFAYAEKNLNYDSLPPKVILHVGQKKHLQEDAALGTIPDDVWNNFIMSTKTRFGLVPYRRGLYGGANFDTLELYGNKYYGSSEGKGKIPWVMKITIKEECRKPEAVSNLATDQKFLNWVLENANYLVKNVNFCLNMKSTTCYDLIVGMQPLAGGREENICDDVMQKFLKDTNPRVVRDSEWDSSWYLRDRSCIEKLEADPKTVLEILANASWSWQSRMSQFHPAANGYGTFAFGMLADALADSEKVEPELLEKVRAKVAASDLRAGSDPSGKQWIRESGVAAVEAYSRCSAKSDQAAFRKIASRLQEDLADPKMLKNSYVPEPGSEFREGKLAAATEAFHAACR